MAFLPVATFYDSNEHRLCDEEPTHFDPKGVWFSPLPSWYRLHASSLNFLATWQLERAGFGNGSALVSVALTISVVRKTRRIRDRIRQDMSNVFQQSVAIASCLVEIFQICLLVLPR